MKILLVSTSSGSRGGGEIFLLRLGQGLVARGHDVNLWCAQHPRMNELAKKFAVFGKVIRSNYTNTYDRPFRCWGAAFDYFAPRRAACEWDALGADIIHLNKQNLEDGLDLIRASALVSRPSLCTVHLTQRAVDLGAKHAELRDWLSWRQLVQFRGPYVAVSEARAKALAEFATLPRKPFVIHNGVSIQSPTELQMLRDLLRKKLKLRPDNFLVLGVGRLTEQKRPILFLRAAQNILQTTPNAQFIWLGDQGPVATKWDQFVSDHNLQNSVCRLPWQDDVISYMAAADLFIHPASFEGMPFALLEAMAAGLPCAITRSLANELIFPNNDNTWIFDDRNIDHCSWPDENQRRSLGACARELIQDQFSIERMIDEYERLYHTLVK